MTHFKTVAEVREYLMREARVGNSYRIGIAYINSARTGLTVDEQAATLFNSGSFTSINSLFISDHTTAGGNGE